MTKGLLISRYTKGTLLIPLLLTNLLSPTIAIFTTVSLGWVKKEYFADNWTKSKKIPKKTWEIFNEAINKKKNSEKIKELFIDRKLITDNNGMAEGFNKFFTNVGQKISNSIPLLSTNPDSYLKKTFKKDNSPFLPLNEIDPVLISDILKSMDPKKSKDMDDISLDLLKSIDTSIAKPLAHIFNLSLKTGTFPSKLKISRVVPIFKNGDKHLCDNYRPISLVNTIAKILEKIVAVKLSNHLELNKLLYIHQFGF